MFDNKVRLLQHVVSSIASLALNGPGEQSFESYNLQMYKLEQQKNMLEEELSSSNRVQEKKHGNDQTNIDNIRKLLSPDTVLIEYINYPIVDFYSNGSSGQASEYGYAAFVLHAGQDKQPLLVDLCDARIVDEIIDDFHQEMVSISESSIPPSGKTEQDAERRLAEKTKRIYELVFAPLKSVIGECKVVFLATDAMLNLIPFDILQDENEQYLIEEYQFNYLSTGRDILRFSDESTTETNIVIVANPDYDFKRVVDMPPSLEQAQSSSPLFTTRLSTFFNEIVEWPPLEHTLSEAKAIEGELHGQKVLLYTDKEAVERVIKKLRSPLILHIATHGFFLSDEILEEETAELVASFVSSEHAQGSMGTTSPNVRFSALLRSGLVFAGANHLGGTALSPDVDDGILTALEISAIPLWGTRAIAY